MNTFVCPSDPRGGVAWTDGTNRAALTSYLGVAGTCSYDEAALTKPGQNGILYINAGVKMGHISDGTSNTVIIGERPPSSTLEYGWQWAGAGDFPYFGATDVVIGVHERVANSTSSFGTPDFFRPGTIRDPQDIHRYHFWSLHTGGGNWAMADGSVKFLGYSVSGPQNLTAGSAPNVLEAMATRNGGEVFQTPD